MRTTILLLAALLLPLAHPAQEIPRIRSFSSQQYQAQQQNWSTAQAAERWMYFANSAGLLEYDGATWTLLPLPNKQPVRAVACADGKVFCGGFAEFGYWEKAPFGGWHYVSLSRTINSEKAQTEEIWHILAGDGYVLFQSFSTIFRYDYERVSLLTPPGNLMFIHDIGGRLVFQVIGEGLYELLPGNSFRFVEGSEALENATVSAIIPIDGESFLAGTTNDGIFLLQNNRCTPWGNPLNERLKKTQLNKGIRLHDGGLALGTILDGLFVLDAQGRLRFHLNQENGLQNNTVLSLHEDQDHNLWAGLDKGVDLIELRSPLTFFTDPSGKTGAVYTAAVFEGSLYIGTNHGVFQRPWPAGNAPFQLIEGTQGQVWELQVFDGQLLCGHNEGTFLIEGSRARKISTITGGWRTIRHPERDDLLVQGSYSGIVIFKKDPFGKWVFSHRADGFLQPIRELLFDVEGNLWALHSHRGMHRIRLDREALRVQEIEHLLPGEFNLHIVQLNDTFCIKADDGYFTYNSRQGSFEQISHLGSIPLPAGARVLPGTNGDWFLSGENGVSLVRQNKLHRFDIQLVPGYEQVVVLERGVYLFCLGDGYALLREPGKTGMPEGAIASPAIRRVEKMGKNGLRLQWSSPEFTTQPLFRYRLEGFERGWSDWKSEFEKEYINLPPGDYRFQVQSRFSEKTGEYAFTIPPPWYFSKWAIFFYVLAAGGGLWLINRIGKKRMERQRLKMEAENQIRLEKERMEAEIRSKNNDLANSTMNLLRKNETLQKIKEELQKLPEAGKPSKELKKLLSLIDEHITSDHDWELLEESFNNVHGNFFKKIKAQYPDLTPGDLRLAAYLKMNLSSKEIAQLLNLSVRGVENKRYRLRKKLGLGEEENLAEFMIQF